MPSGLAAQALKIVAYRQRVLVDELIELLWPDAEPGVGTRRLRNVLWRLRGTCGDLLVRDGNFIRLAPEAVTDSASFRLLGEQAMGRGIPHEEAVKFAEEALRVYTGELLPGDRYEDWAATPRESMARLHMQLLELLLADAVSDQRSAGALKLLDDLIEADPYEERYYVQAAEMLVSSGNRRQALSMIERARRVLADMGVPSSASLGRLFQTIGSGEPDPHQRR
jgi:DNA-binding SARP family transcriptional activator